MAKNKAQVNEGVLDDMDDDGWMAKSQLYQTAKYAIELHKMIQDTDNLEPWVQSKITKCADYLESIKHYMEYEAVNNHPEEVPAEAPVAEAEPLVIGKTSKIEDRHYPITYTADISYDDRDRIEVDNIVIHDRNGKMLPPDHPVYQAEEGFIRDEVARTGEEEGEVVGEGKVVDEAMESDELAAILAKHPEEVAKMKQMGDMDTNSELYMELYSYYSDEMPYGTQKARDGDPVEWIMNKLDDLGIMESQIDEGYESSVLRVMRDHGISAYFSNGVMYVDAMDIDKAKEALELDSDITELPKMVAEKAKESIGSDTEDLWLEKMASAGLKRANEGSMSDIAAAADEVATMIEAGATDQEIMDHTGLRDSQVKFLRNSLQDRPAQYEAKKAK